MAAATAVDAPTGTRRAVVRSERFMEWQRELCSSRATHGGRKRHEDNEVVEGAGTKPFYGKSDEDGMRLQKHEGLEERDAEGEEPAADSQGPEATVVNQRIRVKKQHQRQRTDVKKHGQDHEMEQKRAAPNTLGDSADFERGRMRRCKQQAVQATHARRQPQQLAPQQELPQPLACRRQRHLPRSFTPPKEEMERGLRSLTRNRGNEAVQAVAETMPTSATKGATKRSKRVAHRLANEEPAPPPLKLPKLHLVLTRKEIQEDWMKMTGHKYFGKPKKSTLVQRGLGLCTSLTCPSTIRYLNEPQCSMRSMQVIMSPEQFQSQAYTVVHHSQLHSFGTKSNHCLSLQYSKRKHNCTIVLNNARNIIAKLDTVASHAFDVLVSLNVNVISASMIGGGLVLCPNAWGLYVPNASIVRSITVYLLDVMHTFSSPSKLLVYIYTYVTPTGVGANKSLFPFVPIHCAAEIAPVDTIKPPQAMPART